MRNKSGSSLTCPVEEKRNRMPTRERQAPTASNEAGDSPWLNLEQSVILIHERVTEAVLCKFAPTGKKQHCLLWQRAQATYKRCFIAGACAGH